MGRGKLSQNVGLVIALRREQLESIVPMVRPPLSPQMLTVLLLGRFSAQEILKVTVMPFSRRM